MKIDMKGTTALHNGRVVLNSQLAIRIMTYLKSLWLSGWDTYLLRCEIHAERMVLANLSDQELADIGIDRAAAVAESQRGFKDLPSNRNH